MKTVKQKLNARAGASIAIALVFFLFCVIICSVILTAATVNAGRFRDIHSEEQAYLTSSSAAVLLRDCLEGYTFEAKSSTLLRERETRALSTSYSGGETGLSEWLRLSAQTVYDHGLASSQEVEIQVEGMETAYAVLYMDENYDVTATVYLKTKDGEEKNPVELQLNASVETSSRTEVSEETQNTVVENQTRVRHEVTQVSWPLGSLQRGGSA